MEVDCVRVQQFGTGALGPVKHIQGNKFRPKECFTASPRLSILGQTVTMLSSERRLVDNIIFIRSIVLF